MEVLRNQEKLNGYYHSLEFDRFQHVKRAYMNGILMTDIESI